MSEDFAGPNLIPTAWCGVGVGRERGARGWEEESEGENDKKVKEFNGGIDSSLQQDLSTARPGVFLPDCLKNIRMWQSISFIEKLTRPLEWRTQAASFAVTFAVPPHQNKTLELIQPYLQ